MAYRQALGFEEAAPQLAVLGGLPRLIELELN